MVDREGGKVWMENREEGKTGGEGTWNLGEERVGVLRWREPVKGERSRREKKR